MRHKGSEETVKKDGETGGVARNVQKFTDLNIEKHILHSRKLLSNLT